MQRAGRSRLVGFKLHCDSSQSGGDYSQIRWCSSPFISGAAETGTFTAVALAASYLHSVKGMDSKEIVVVIPVDSYVEASFLNSFINFQVYLPNHKQILL